MYDADFRAPVVEACFCLGTMPNTALDAGKERGARHHKKSPTRQKYPGASARRSPLKLMVVATWLLLFL